MKFEFTHDTLARTVFNKSSAEAKARRQVKNMIEREFQRYKAKGILLQQDDLDELRPFQRQINFSEEEVKFIRKSRRAIRRKRRRTILIATGIIILLLIALFVSLIATTRATYAQAAAEKSAKENAYQAKVFESKLAIQVEGNASKSIQKAIEALEVDTTVYNYKNEDFLKNFNDAFFQGDLDKKSYFYKAYAPVLSKLIDIAFAKNRDHITALLYHNQIAIFDPVSRVPKFETLGQNLTNVHFTPDKKFILGITEKKEIVIWDVNAQLKNTVRLDDVPESLVSIEQSPDGNYILGVAKQNKFHLWTRTGKKIKFDLSDKVDLSHSALKTLGLALKEVTFSKDSKHVMLALHDLAVSFFSFNAADKSTSVFIVPIEQPSAQILKLPEENIVSASLSPKKDAYLILTNEGQAVSRNLRIRSNGGYAINGNQRVLYNRGKKNISTNYSPKGNYVVTVAQNQGVSIWNSANSSSKVVQVGDVLNTEGEIIKNIIWTSDESKFILHTNSSTAKVYQLNKIGKNTQLELIGELVGHEANINHLTFSNDGQRIASCSGESEGLLLEWLPYNSQKIHPAWPEQGLNLFQALTDSDYIICQKAEETPKVYSQKTNAQVAVLEQHGDITFNLVASSTDANHIFLAKRNDRTLYHWKKTQDGNYTPSTHQLDESIYKIFVQGEDIYVYTIHSSKLYHANLAGPIQLAEIAIDFPKAPYKISLENSVFTTLKENEIRVSPLHNSKNIKTQSKILSEPIDNIILAAADGIIGLSDFHLIKYLTPSETTADTLYNTYSFTPFPEKIQHAQFVNDALVLISVEGKIKHFLSPQKDKSLFSLQYNGKAPLEKISASKDTEYLYTLDANGTARVWKLSISERIKALTELGILGTNKELQAYQKKLVEEATN